VTWKGKREIFEGSRRQQEIEFLLYDPDKMAEIFLAIGLEHYAHQEKKRVSWKYKDWRFDLDQYPQMPAYLEIEGISNEHIMEAIDLLSLQGYERCFDGERLLIMKKYGLDWLDMRF
jgi:adenylate cyclase, class 2